MCVVHFFFLSFYFIFSFFLKGKIWRLIGHHKQGHTKTLKQRPNSLYGANRKNMAISNAHYMFIFSPRLPFLSDLFPFASIIFLPAKKSLSPVPFYHHSTCPLIGILLFLYLCIPLFIRNHMLMKSVIINLKYLIFRSVSASEGGCLEEQRQQQEEVIGEGGWKKSCCSLSFICIRFFKGSGN